MSSSLLIFAIALLALLSLFILKAIERRGKVVAPLARFRTVGDPFIEKSVVEYGKMLRQKGKDAHVGALRWGKERLTELETVSVKKSHALVYRLHRYLMQRQQKLSRNAEHVSAHLKEVNVSKDVEQKEIS